MKNSKRIGPLRKVKHISLHAESMFDTNRVELECGHKSSTNGLSAHCRECALTDEAWRKKAIPRLVAQLAEVEQWINEGNERYGSHTGNGHACDRCRQANELRRIIQGPVVPRP